MTTYDERSALLVVDVQNDFADPNGSLYVEGGDAIVSVIDREIEGARHADALVVYTQDWHPEVTPHFSKDGGVWPVHCVMGTWGAEFHPDLDVAGDVVRKGSDGEDGYSGFSMKEPVTGAVEPTSLESLLRARDIERVVVVGLATDYCIRETALDALDRRFATTVLAHAVRAVDLEQGDGRRALERVVESGGVVE
ncbi:MAG: isochorismatase family protein [Actinomycetota bacterium]